MKNPLLAFFLTVTLLLAAPLYAEIYKYIDENGQKRWTDDLSQVPKEQRSSAQRYETDEGTPMDAAAKQVQTVQPESSIETKIDVTDTGEPSQTDDLSREALEKEKSDLDSQYQQLLEERKQLEQIKTEATTFNARAALNDRISEFNRKTEQYETQLNAFNEKINTYNQKIMSKQSRKSE